MQAAPGVGVIYRAVTKLGGEQTDALVLTCSDRRYRGPIEEFVRKDLGLSNYDIFAVPGGVYMLSFADALPKNLKVGTRMLKFVLQNHMPPRIVLIAHQNCSRYKEGFATRLRRPGFALEEQQKRDLRQVGAELRESFDWVKVETYFARQVDGDTVEFEAT